MKDKVSVNPLALDPENNPGDNGQQQKDTVPLKSYGTLCAEAETVGQDINIEQCTLKVRELEQTLTLTHTVSIAVSQIIGSAYPNTHVLFLVLTLITCCVICHFPSNSMKDKVSVNPLALDPENNPGDNGQQQKDTVPLKSYGTLCAEAETVGQDINIEQCTLKVRELEQTLTLTHTVSIAVSQIIGSGAMCFGELGALCPKSGGELQYIKLTYGRMASFVNLWVRIQLRDRISHIWACLLTHIWALVIIPYHPHMGNTKRSIYGYTMPIYGHMFELPTPDETNARPVGVVDREQYGTRCNCPYILNLLPVSVHG
eukprot:sb/3466980/